LKTFPFVHFMVQILSHKSNRVNTVMSFKIIAALIMTYQCTSFLFIINFRYVLKYFDGSYLFLKLKINLKYV
jgi:hypothetical protein